jgi:tetratricopeptide (TPR) repeat protein
MRRFIVLFLLISLAVLPVLADTIVLKSGRRISATNVVEEGNRVYFDTPSGRLSFPKSSVERIERGGESAWSGGGSSDNRSVDLAAAKPSMDAGEGYEDVMRATVKDGSLDREFISKLEGAAQAGGTPAVNRVAAAHHAAALYEVQKGNLDEGIAHYKRALNYAPDHLGVLLNVAYLHLKKSEYTAALEYLERAKRVAPENADVAKLMGWAYYGANKIEEAVREWKRAFKLRPDVETQQALLKAEKDKEAEERFKHGESIHFNLSYDGEAAPGLAREILKELENHFPKIESGLNFAPKDSIGVILYTGQAFQDVTQAPGWVGALNDGRIRVPVEGLSSMTGTLSRVLMHELTHSFIHQKTRGHCPVWLNEGIAQWMEGKRSGQNAEALVAYYDAGRSVSLGLLEGSWMGLPGNGAAYAYAWSLAAVEYLVQANGMSDIERILERLTTEPSPEAALRSVLRTTYAELEAETIKYLKKSYLK